MIHVAMRSVGIALGLWLLMMPCLFAEEAMPLQAAGDAVPQVPHGEDMTGAVPGMDASIQTAQQEVQDPFVTRFGPSPTAPEVSQSGKTAPSVTAVLQGIGLGGREAYAVIGDSVYYEGEEKNGIKLLEARRREVDIIVNGAALTLSLFPEEDLKKAKERRERKNAARGLSQPEPSQTGPESFPKRGQDIS